MAGQSIVTTTDEASRASLPGDGALWPNPVHIAWHRKNKFQGA